MSASKQPVVRPGILDISPYVPGISHVDGAAESIKLSSNESAIGPSPLAIAAYQARATELHRYPDGGSVELRASISHRFGLEADRIVCGTGSDELIALLVRAYAGPGDEVLQSRHGFSLYGIAAQSVGAFPVLAQERNLTTDVDAMLAAVTPRTRLVFIANPNNPTGTYLPASEVARLHAGLPSDVVFVIDSAYAEFVTAEDYEPGIDLVRSAENVVMLRTFSKIFALGSLRVGWGYSSPPIVDVLNRIRGVFNTTTAAQAAAVAAMADKDHFKRSIAHTETWRAWLTEKISALGNGITVVPSVANFILVRFRSPAIADAADLHLKSRGLIVRKMGGYGLPDSLRMSIGLEHEMTALVDAMTDFVRQA